MEDMRIPPISPVTVDSALDEDEIENWEGEGGAVLYDSEPEAEGDDAEEG